MLRHTFRSLLRTPTFTGAALICLALGIGATAAIFSIVNAVVLRPLPYHDSDSLVRLYTEFPTFPNGGLHKFWVSGPELFDLRAAAKSFDAIGAWVTSGANMAGQARPLRVDVAYVTANLPRMLEATPLLGHLITKEDDVPGAPPVVMLAYGLWQRAFGGDRNIVGRDVEFNNTKVRVIAVMPPGFIFPPGEAEPAEAWTALQLDPKSPNRSSHDLNVLARLRPGITVAQARDEMSRLVAHWGETASPHYHTFRPKTHTVSMYPFYDDVVGGVRNSMLMLLGAVVFVLLIACVNVANLLLARSESRQREIAIRRAIGASTGRLFRQFITEGVVLSLIGAILGTALAYASIRVIAAANPGSIPRAGNIHLDSTVLLFTLAVAVITGVLFGLTPFLHVSAIQVFNALKASSGRASATAAASRFRRSMVVVQVAMAFVLVAGAGLMLRGFWKLQQVNPGFRPDHLLTFSLSLPEAAYRGAATPQFWSELEARLAQLPGVRSVTMMDGLPPLRPEIDDDTQIEGFVKRPNGPIQNVAYYQVAGDRFFETLGARLIEGRFLEPRDGEKNTPGVVVNETMARTFWPHESAVGRHVKPDADARVWCTVVGVVADIKNGGINKPAGTELFIPYRLRTSTEPNVVIRTAGDPLSLAREARQAVASIDPSLPVAKLRTMDDVIAAATSRPRFLTLVLGMFSVLALTLAAVGIYGVMSYSVERRTSEFGIRMALGAEPRSLLLQVVGQGLALGLAGITAGLAAALLLTRSLEALLFGVSRFDPASYLVTAAVLVAATIAASFLPAVRAMRTEPAVALRYE